MNNGEAQAILEQARAAAKGIKSISISSESVFRRGVELRRITSQDWIVGEDRYSKVSIDGDLRSEMLRVGSKSYTRNSEAESWYASSTQLHRAVGSDRGSSFPTYELNLPIFDLLSHAGQDDIRGHAAAHLVGALSNPRGSMTVEIWIGLQDLYIYRVKRDETHLDGTHVVELTEYSDFNGLSAVPVSLTGT